MTRIAMILSAVLTAGFVTVKTIDLGLGETFQISEAVAQDQSVHDRFVSYQCFKRTLDDSLESLGKGRIALKEAHGRVLSAARAYHPVYLHFLKFAEPGQTVSERLAHNLIGHIRSIEEFHPDLQARLPILEEELRDFVAEQNPAN